MENTGTKWYVVFGVFMLVLLFGAGGYYLGRYMDIQEAKKKSADNIPAVVKTTKYTNTDLKISFDYPETWTVETNSGTPGVTIVKVVSPAKSELVFTKDTTDEKLSLGYCNLADKDGKEDGAQKCEFLEGKKDNDFARYADLVVDSTGDTWNVAEQGKDQVSNWFKYDPKNGFKYILKDVSDTSDMDAILMTLIRE